MLVPTGAKVIATTQHTVHSGANSMSRDFPDTAGQHQEPSVFQSTLPLATKLERARTELLDLSARNRLLNIPRNAKSSRSIEIVDELTTEIYRLLVTESKALTFAAGRSPPSVATEESADVEELGFLAQPEDDGVDERGIANRHSDTKLQTRLTPKGLQKRLLDLYTDARTLEEEQGVNVLYLALGTLKWVDPANAASIRYAPLILVPVGLERGNAGEKFKLRWRQEDPAPNLSLEAYLARLHRLTLPSFEAGDDFDTGAYMKAVAEAVSGKSNWSVAPDDMVLGFFSFAKFLMYRDLDPDVWPKDARITDQPLIRALLSDGFAAVDDLIPEDAQIDPHVPPADMLHIVDSDSSQTLAVHEVGRGRDLVIQGPPGTGKSQTIANLVASAVSAGKTVLFVAEKMAALEVVKRRLDNAGVGDACLELHSNKANKRVILEELRRTWALRAPKGDGASTLHARLMEARDQLNEHAARMHQPHGTSTLTPFEVIGHLARLRQDGRTPTDIALTAPEDWSPDDFRLRHAVLKDMAERVREIGRPVDHVWSGVGLKTILPTEVERLIRRIASLAARLHAIRTDLRTTSALLELPAPASPADITPLLERARHIADAPALPPSAILAPEWDLRTTEINVLLAAGAAYAQASGALTSVFSANAWKSEVGIARTVLAILPNEFPLDAFGRIERLSPQLAILLAEAAELAALLGQPAPNSLSEIERATAIAERVAAAPDASPTAFSAECWNDELERAADLAEAIDQLESTRAEIDGHVTDAAWTTDLTNERATLAAHGGGFFRAFSGKWRRANRLVNSILTVTDSPLDLETQLRLLDGLRRGKAALKTVLDENEFGRAAFGSAWRGEKSASQTLIILVRWMRTIRPLGPEPRLIAARAPSRPAIRERERRVRELLTQLRPLLDAVWSDVRASTARVFGHVASVEAANLRTAGETFAAIQDADRLSRTIMCAVPASLAERRMRLAQLEAGQRALADLSEGHALGQVAFGSAWQGAASDWTVLQTAATWLTANPDIRPLVVRLTDRVPLGLRATAIEKAVSAFVADLVTLFAELEFDTTLAFGWKQPVAVPMEAHAARLAAWLAEDESLSKWVAYSGRAAAAHALGVGDSVERLHDGRLPPADVLPAFEMSYYEALFADQARSAPELAQFDGATHSRIVREFADLDRQRIATAALEVVRAHHRQLPPTGGAPVGPLGILKAEMGRKRNHKPIRQLMHLSSKAVQALKPVFMMSPLSVAQFLPPGMLTFDLLVMDEASQIQPVDALGAIARCKQVVVVGDPQQLPPTAFFAKMTGATDDSDDQESAQVADIESILGLFSARGLPTRMLRWHYRSRHPSLIAVSNSQFYENKLFIVPTPHTTQPGMGLAFHHIPNGIFETGGSRTNPLEAKTVAEAIVTHARKNPELSLGVAAFSAAQRRAIQDQLELLRRHLSPDQEAFFQSHPSEPFFIKNLENVHGDERDVIFISVGYGPSAPGLKPMMRFGPLGADGGERRLNVLISRAKRRCDVFASMTDEDIPSDFAHSRRGVRAFKVFLHFARTGRLSTIDPVDADRDPGLEGQVARAIRARGYQVHTRVGIAGLFVDLAIVDPDHPDRYVLGVEFDGASYRDARAARDRDRLRQSVLEDHGWIIQRIWSTDWFQRPKEQLELIIARIKDAKLELRSRSDKPLGGAPAPILEPVRIERHLPKDIGRTNPAQPNGYDLYTEASLSIPEGCWGFELHQTPTESLSQLAVEAVRIEGPVHVQEVVLRIRDAWGLSRAGHLIQGSVEKAIALAVRRQALQKDGPFLSIPGTLPKVRDRSQVASLTLRKPESLPPDEICAAAINIVRTNFGATTVQIVQAVSRAFGFKSASTPLRDAIERAIDNSLARGELRLAAGLLTLPDPKPA